jgi:glycosyltransferase involved in cell wall biosynthesis
MRVLYDGWSLVYSPISPQSLHLQAILAHLPDEVTPVVALPGAAPAWLEGVEVHVRSVPDTPSGRLRWEQFYLPREGLNMLHLTAPSAPILGNKVILLSPSVFDKFAGDIPGSPEMVHILDRLRHSLAYGGMVRVKEVLWPVDLPAPQLPVRLTSLSPILPPGFTSEPALETSAVDPSAAALLEKLDLPEEFIIYHGPGDMQSLERLMQAWHWAASAIGETHPLVLLGFDSDALTNLSNLAEQYDLGRSLHVARDVTPDLIHHLYRQCSAVFHPAPASPWSGPVRLALACGKPLVASENDLTDALAGPAAYLAPPGDPRALGAALVTVIVEEQVAERLSTAAKRRAANWEMGKFSSQLWGVYSQTFAE